MSEKTILITGASSGIGEACALYFDRQGWRVFASVRKPLDAARLASQASSRLTPLILDVADEASIQAALATVRAALGENGLDGLVNNAGAFTGGPLEHLPLAALRQQFEVNVLGQMAVVQAFIPLLRQNHGRIVFVGSTSGFLATPLLGPYAASKFAIRALADALRNELTAAQVPVSLIEVGKVNTPIWEKALALVDDMKGVLPANAVEYYTPMIEATAARASQRGQSGIEPVKVAEAIHRVLTTASPKPKYLVGADAHLQALLVWLTPAGLLDKLIRWQMGI
jgi:NAD(P)-dependent dehydrogenase (short-subunit alcohol dehydrogenase family)